jgi:hypothetical protein
MPDIGFVFEVCLIKRPEIIGKKEDWDYICTELFLRLN